MNPVYVGHIDGGSFTYPPTEHRDGWGRLSSRLIHGGGQVPSRRSQYAAHEDLLTCEEGQLSKYLPVDERLFTRFRESPSTRLEVRQLAPEDLKPSESHRSSITGIKARTSGIPDPPLKWKNEAVYSISWESWVISNTALPLTSCHPAFLFASMANMPSDAAKERVFIQV